MESQDHPRPFPEWSTNPFERDEDAAHTYGYHLIVHCRDMALRTLPPEAPPEIQAAVQKAVDTALHNVNDMLEGFWKLEAGAEHTIELALAVRVLNSDRKVVEELAISPCKLDLPIGYWKWARDREFRSEVWRPR
jgi:hypothetical protein